MLMIFPEEFIFQTAKITLNEAVKSTKEPKDAITFAIFFPRLNSRLNIQFEASRGTALTASLTTPSPKRFKKKSFWIY